MDKSAYNRYKSRPTRRTRSYIIEDSTIRRIGVLAKRYDVYPSSIVDLLLQRALTEVETGRWPLKARAVAYDASWDD